MPDEDGYPTGTDILELRRIINMRPINIEHLIEHLEKIWWCAERGMTVKRNCKGKPVSMVLHTLGWSGNEEIMTELRGSERFMVHWEKTMRGGHYYFMLRRVTK